MLDGQETKRPAREQEVFALNIRGDRIYRTKVERIHYDKNLGIAEMTPDGMKNYCLRWFPGRYDSFARHVDEHPESLFIDFEDILSAIEGKDGYNSLLHIARNSGISSPEHKGFLTCNLVMHAMRSHEMMTAMINATGSLGLEKWEYFLLLKNAWGNPLILARAVTPLALASWVFYRTSTHCFPLCDSPVMINSDTLMAVISPRLLLEVNLNTTAPSEDSWTIQDGISPEKFSEFRRRAIANTFKDIIFHDVDELERWRTQPEFRARIITLSNLTTAQSAVADAANRVIWAINGFGRVPPQFEDWVRHLF